LPFSRPRSVRSIAVLAAAAACTIGTAGIGTIALAAAPADPPGANGTVKIDGVPLDGKIDNEPHVSCEFAVNFFGFDAGETADILFTVQPPTGPGTELLRIDDAVISDDPAGGGAPDPDASFPFSFDDLGLDAFTAHPQQGYHVKLTIESDATPGAGKHKVFWIQPCESPTPTPTSPSPTPTTPSPSPTTPSPTPTTPSPTPTTPSPTPTTPPPSPTTPSPTTASPTPTTPAPTPTTPAPTSSGPSPSGPHPSATP
jgi:hypothetical protein